MIPIEDQRVVNYNINVPNKERQTPLISISQVLKKNQIILSSKNMENIHEWYYQFVKEVDVKSLVLFPFLEEGTFKLENIIPKTDAFLYFLFDEGYFYIHLYIKIGQKYTPVCGYYFREDSMYVLFDKNPGEDASTEFTFFNLSDEVPFEKVSSVATTMYTNFVAYMFYVDWINKNPEYIVQEKRAITPPKPGKSKKKGKKGKKTKSKQKIDNKHIVYELKDVLNATEETFFEKQTKEYKRRVISWTVRGHFRRFKNGKVTWVKPHLKGEGRFRSKDYNVEKEFDEHDEANR